MAGTRVAVARLSGGTMKKLATILFAATLLSAVASAQSAAPTRAAASTLLPGTYWESPSGPVRMERLTMSGGGAVHTAKMFVPALTPQVVYTFRGANAPFKTGPQPTFLIEVSPYLVGTVADAPRNFVIVQMREKKDHRELQITHGGSAFTFKSGFGKTPELDIKQNADGSFTLQPKEPLKPGEYLITQRGYSGYDFEVTEPSKTTAIAKSQGKG